MHVIIHYRLTSANTSAIRKGPWDTTSEGTLNSALVFSANAGESTDRMLSNAQTLHMYRGHLILRLKCNSTGTGNKLGACVNVGDVGNVSYKHEIIYRRHSVGSRRSEYEHIRIVRSGWVLVQQVLAQHTR